MRGTKKKKRKRRSYIRHNKVGVILKTDEQKEHENIYILILIILRNQKTVNTSSYLPFLLAFLTHGAARGTLPLETCDASDEGATHYEMLSQLHFTQHTFYYNCHRRCTFFTVSQILS